MKDEQDKPVVEPWYPLNDNQFTANDLRMSIMELRKIVTSLCTKITALEKQ